MAKSLIRSWPAFVLSFALALPAYAAAPYYEGKTVRIIVGFSAGGGFDTYSRLIARHLGKHIPGGPGDRGRKHAWRRQPRRRQSCL